MTEGARLSVSFIGYDAAQVEVGNRTHLTVVLKENNQLLDDVVVIGYGVQKKVNLTGSVAVRQMSEIENQPMTHASQALYSMPGVSYQPGFGEARQRRRDDPYPRRRHDEQFQSHGAGRRHGVLAQRTQPPATSRRSRC